MSKGTRRNQIAKREAMVLLKKNVAASAKGKHLPDAFFQAVERVAKARGCTCRWQRVTLDNLTCAFEAADKQEAAYLLGMAVAFTMVRILEGRA